MDQPSEPVAAHAEGQAPTRAGQPGNEFSRIAQDLQIKRVQVDAVARMLDEGATVPFIARFRKDRTMGLDEPAVRQTLDEGAGLVVFSGDKLLGGPQCGVIAGRADLVRKCAEHPLMRALRPGGHTILLLQEVLQAYVNRNVCDTVPFWQMFVEKTDRLKSRADKIVRSTGTGRVTETVALIGAGSAPGASIPSFAVRIDRDIARQLRARETPIIARVEGGHTFIDMRTVHWLDDEDIVRALRSLR